MSNSNFSDGTSAPSSSDVSTSIGSISGSGNHSTTNSNDSVEEDEQEDPSSSPSQAEQKESQDHLIVEATLSAFRDQWQKEISSESKTKEKHKDEREEKEEDDIEAVARALFMEGVENERKGSLYEAIRFYKKAVQLVPDIEFKIYESTRGMQKDRSEQVSEVAVSPEPESGDEEDTSEDSEVELLPKLQRWLSRAPALCAPAQAQRATHISSLPIEILLYIFQWVVSCELDIRSLEMCSLVCRGFYICSMDSEIWRLICQRIWGLNSGGLTNHFSWREMYLKRPHLNFMGCYISKTTYVRHGENSFQDQFYRPWHLVEYYRYLRFFPGSKVLMLTTAETPIQIISHLRNRNPKNPAILSGHYRLTDDKVTIILRRIDRQAPTNNRYFRGRQQNADVSEQTFHIELLVKPWRREMNCQLIWSRYQVYYRRGATETATNFEVLSTKFPPFWFSRVKSYSAASERPLE